MRRRTKNRPRIVTQREKYAPLLPAFEQYLISEWRATKRIARKYTKYVSNFLDQLGTKELLRVEDPEVTTFCMSIKKEAERRPCMAAVNKFRMFVWQSLPEAKREQLRERDSRKLLRGKVLPAKLLVARCLRLLFTQVLNYRGWLYRDWENLYEFKRFINDFWEIAGRNIRLYHKLTLPAFALSRKSKLPRRRLASRKNHHADKHRRGRR